MTTTLRILKQGNAQFIFENGLTVSAYVGIGSYSDSDANTQPFTIATMTDPNGSFTATTAEIGIFVTNPENNGKWVTDRFIDTGGDDVAGNVPVTVMLNLLEKIEKMTTMDVALL